MCHQIQNVGASRFHEPGIELTVSTGWSADWEMWNVSIAVNVSTSAL